MEEWRDIPNYEGLYQVSNLGRVKSLKRVVIRKNGIPQTINEMILKPRKDEKGYLMVNFYKNGTRKNHRIYRLVALCFIPNANNDNCINHLNKIRTDNNYLNLEWCNQKYNVRYSLAKAVNQYDLEGNFIKTWDCMREAGEQLNIWYQGIYKCCKGIYKKSGGYVWRYANENN